MKIYNYKNEDYYSLEELLKKLPKISFPKLDNIPDELLAKFNVKIIYAEKIPYEIKIERINKVRKIRNKLLEETDKYVLPDYPIEQLDYDNVIGYRQYLRDYTKKDIWWASSPKNLAEWTNNDNNFYE